MLKTEKRSIKIAAPAHRALKAAGIDTFVQLCDYSEEDKKNISDSEELRLAQFYAVEKGEYYFKQKYRQWCLN